MRFLLHFCVSSASQAGVFLLHNSCFLVPKTEMFFGVVGCAEYPEGGARLERYVTRFFTFFCVTDPGWGGSENLAYLRDGINGSSL